MRGTRLSLLAGLALLLLGAAPLQAAPTAEDRCASRMAEASGRYLDCAMRENGRAAKHRRAVNLDRCERKLGRMTAGALRRWGPEVCPSVNQVGGEATTLGDQLSGLVSQMSEAVGVSDEDLYDDAALCAAQKAKLVGQDLRCRARVLARATRWDRAPHYGACPERRLARKLARIEKKYGAACPGEGDAGTLATRGQLALSEVIDSVAPWMQVDVFEVVDPSPLQTIQDSDGDGLSDALEIGFFGTNPNDCDTDRDGRCDGLEISHHASDPLNYDLRLPYQGKIYRDSYPAAMKNARLPKGVAAPSFVFGEEGITSLFGGSALGFVGGIIGIICDFASCNPSYEDAPDVSSIALTVADIATRITRLESQNTVIANHTNSLIESLEQTESSELCKQEFENFNTWDSGGSATSNLGVSLAEAKRDWHNALLGKSDKDYVTLFFEKMKLGTAGTDHAYPFPSLAERIIDRATGFRAHSNAIGTSCNGLLTANHVIEKEGTSLGGDALSHIARTAMQSKLQSIFFNSLFFNHFQESSQAWYFATPKLRKAAIWLAMQNQMAAAVVSRGAAGVQLARGSTSCSEGHILLGAPKAGGKCYPTGDNGVLPPSGNAWTKKASGRYKYPASVTTRAVRSVNNICNAWALEQATPCESLETDETKPGFYCQRILCEPDASWCAPSRGGSESAAESLARQNICNYWATGRDYVDTALVTGEPWTNATYVYEPTKKTLWLKDPKEGFWTLPGEVGDWSDLQGFADSTSYMTRRGGTQVGWVAAGVSGSRASGQPHGCWPECSTNFVTEALLTPATKSHWMGTGPALLTPNPDGMMGSALSGGETHTIQQRTSFAPVLAERMRNRGALEWIDGASEIIFARLGIASGRCSTSSKQNANDRCESDYQCAMQCSAGPGKCKCEFPPDRGVDWDVSSGNTAAAVQRTGTCSDTSASIHRGQSCRYDWECGNFPQQCDPTKESTCSGGTYPGAPCDEASDCGVGGTCQNLNQCVCKSSPGKTEQMTKDEVLHEGNFACAAGWLPGEFLFMGAAYEMATVTNDIAPACVGGDHDGHSCSENADCGESGLCWNQPQYRTLDQSWGFRPTGYQPGTSSDYDEHSWTLGEVLGKLGECRTSAGELFQYPYVREHYYVGNSYHATDDHDEVYLNDLINGRYSGKLFHHNGYCGSETCDNNTTGRGMSPVGGWLRQGGLSCNWVERSGTPFDHCSSSASWAGGGGCNRRDPKKKGGSPNDLSFEQAAKCGTGLGGVDQPGFTMGRYVRLTTTFDEGCSTYPQHQNDEQGWYENVYGCKTIRGFDKSYMPGRPKDQGNTCLYPISNSGYGKLQYFAFPVACKGGSHAGCQNHKSAGPTSSNEFRQCLNFLGSPNCAHLGVQSPWLMKHDELLKDRSGNKIWPLVGPGGVLSQVEMVASMVRNSMLRQGECGRTASRSVPDASKPYRNVFETPVLRAQGFYYDPGEIRYGDAFQRSLFPTAAIRKNIDFPMIDTFDESVSEEDLKESRPLGTMWPVIDLVSLDAPEQICPGARDWSDVRISAAPARVDQTGTFSSVTTLEECITHVLSAPVDGKTLVEGAPDCKAKHTANPHLFSGPDILQLPALCQLQPGSVGGDPSFGQACYEMCDWVDRCVAASRRGTANRWLDQGHGRYSGYTVAERFATVLEKLHTWRTGGQNEISSCCSTGLCEQEYVSAIDGIFPSMRASYADRAEEGKICKKVHDLDQANRGRVYGNGTTVHKVDGLQQCFGLCSSSSCEAVHYNSTWCTVFSNCSSDGWEVVDYPYGGTLYRGVGTDAAVTSHLADPSNHAVIWSDQMRIPPGALYGNRPCMGDHPPFAPSDETVNQPPGASGPEDQIPSQSGGTYKYSTPGSSSPSFVDCAEHCSVQNSCHFFSYIGADYSYNPQVHDQMNPESQGTASTCTIFTNPGAFHTGDRCTNPESRPEGWAVWAKPEAETWSSSWDCTRPGRTGSQTPTCSRVVSSSEMDRILESNFFAQE